MLTVSTDDGALGFAVGGIGAEVVERVIERLLVAEHPLYPEAHLASITLRRSRACRFVWPR
jgi:hypothetical protein